MGYSDRCSGLRSASVRHDRGLAASPPPRYTLRVEGTSRPSFAGQYLRDPRDGPLPALLLLLTITTGLVDAVSILSLGRVFVANMTGNVVFIAFAVIGVPGFSLIASVAALIGFLIGAGLAGVAIKRFGNRRAELLRVAAWAEWALLLVTGLVLSGDHSPFSRTVQVVTVTIAGLALGIQNAVARTLAIADLTTTVLTMTLTGIAADLRSGRIASRRLFAVAAMFGGALAGAAIVRHGSPGAPMLIAAGLAGIVAASLTASLRRGSAAWQLKPAG